MWVFMQSVDSAARLLPLVPKTRSCRLGVIRKNRESPAEHPSGMCIPSLRKGWSRLPHITGFLPPRRRARLGLCA